LAILIAGWSIVLALLVLVMSGEKRHDILLLSIGILAGFLGTGVASIRMLISAWPVYDSVVDWSKVELMETEANRRSI